jgi:hypothetical protein
MNKKFWLIILIIISIGILFWYFQNRIFEKSLSESLKEKSQEELHIERGVETIELEKPPFIK